MCDPVGQTIAGRAPGVHLNAQGAAEADQLGIRLSGLPISAIYSSPMERAIETAGPIAARHGLQVVPAPGLMEIDFGSWTGKTLGELEGVPEWRTFNSFRSGSRIPGGENMAEVLARTLAEIDRIRRAHNDPGALVALVSHGDVLRVLIGHLFGVPLDLLHRLEISPASVTVITLEEYGPQLLLMNSTAGWPPAVLSAQKG